MKLNCDLGEGFGHYSLGNDEQVMSKIDMANIACGFHASDPTIMARTLQLAKHCKVVIGAHPSYPDRQGFGRRSMALNSEEITHLIHYQIATLDGMAKVQGLALSYVKPHGALYNDMMADNSLLETVVKAVANYPLNLKLMLLSQADNTSSKAIANKYTVPLIYEVFADRQYNEDGSLVSRAEKNAVLDEKKLLNQVAQLKQFGTITTKQGTSIKLQCDSLCVHGDNPAALKQIDAIRRILLNHDNK
jgi:UPF0271 protein